MRRIALFALAMLSVAQLAAAGECYVSDAVPVVHGWTLTAKPGGFVVDATLTRRHPNGPSPAATYFAEDGARWWHFLALRPAGSSDPYAQVDCTIATVTDSTFHLQASWPAGSWEYGAIVDGYYDSQHETCSLSLYDGVITIVDPTPTVRASWGSVKARYGR